MKKITRATLKAFIRKNKDSLYISNLSHFDGMVDGVRPIQDKGFKPATPTTDQISYTLGIKGAWLVGHSRDWFSSFECDGFTGIHVSNCCGSFELAIKTDAA